MQGEEFLGLSLQQVCSLISSDKLTVSTEERVRKHKLHTHTHTYSTDLLKKSTSCSESDNRTYYIYTSLKICRHLGCIRLGNLCLCISHILYILHPVSSFDCSRIPNDCVCLRMSTGKSTREQLCVILLSEQQEQSRWRMVQSHTDLGGSCQRRVITYFSTCCCVSYRYLYF